MGKLRSTGMVTRYVAWFGLIAMLIVLLFGQGLGGFNVEVPQWLVGIILITSGIMISIETIFTRDFPKTAQPFTINWLLGIPSAIIAILLGVAWIMNINGIINVFSGFVGGIYLAAILILLYEGITALFGIEV